MMRILYATIVLALALIVASAPARRIEAWTYDRLFEEADVIVIASTRETVASDDVSSDERWKASLVGQRTTFSVIHTLKGKVDDGPITVLHFKLKDGVMTSDGPLLVAFRTKGLAISGGGSEKERPTAKYSVQLETPQYLLFLKRAEGDRFEPVSGQIDPGLSVKEIYSPLPEVMDGK